MEITQSTLYDASISVAHFKLQSHSQIVSEERVRLRMDMFEVAAAEETDLAVQPQLLNIDHQEV